MVFQRLQNNVQDHDEDSVDFTGNWGGKEIWKILRCLGAAAREQPGYFCETLMRVRATIFKCVPFRKQDNVRRKYIELAKKYHPDTPKTASREKFLQVDEVILIWKFEAKVPKVWQDILIRLTGSCTPSLRRSDCEKRIRLGNMGSTTISQGRPRRISAGSRRMTQGISLPLLLQS